MLEGNVRVVVLFTTKNQEFTSYLNKDLHSVLKANKTRVCDRCGGDVTYCFPEN